MKSCGRPSVLIRLLGLLILAGCGGGGGAGPSAFSSGEVLLSRNFGTIYIEGSCDGSDNNGRNVTSIGSRDGKLLARIPGGCNVDVDFKLEVAQLTVDSFVLYTELKNNSGTLALVSIPAQPPLDRFPTELTTIRFFGDNVVFECETTVPFSNIPQGCIIPNLPPPNNKVGLVRDSSPYVWGELKGPFGTIRREKIDGSCSRILSYRHPDTNNFEVDWNRIPLRAGQTFTCRERISIF